MKRPTLDDLKTKIDVLQKERFRRGLIMAQDPNDANKESYKKINDYLEKLGELMVKMEIEEEMKKWKKDL